MNERGRAVTAQSWTVFSLNMSMKVSEGFTVPISTLSVSEITFMINCLL